MHTRRWRCCADTFGQVLCIRGFLAARKHADRIMLLVEMMAGSGFPCYRAGSKTAQALRRRFALHLTEAQARSPPDPTPTPRIPHHHWRPAQATPPSFLRAC